jgi:hypothetical protein
MKTILILLVMVSPAVAQEPLLQKGRQVLFDFRNERNSASQKISAATERMVLSRMFRRYLKDQSQCNQQFDASNNSDYLAAARRAGEIVPSIFDVATGSFTAPGQTQTLYVISVGECNASHADSFGTKRAAIFSGQQLVADLDVDFKQNVVRKTDLNSDGIDEVLLTAADMHQGVVDEVASLVSFQNGRVRMIHDFGLIIEDSCASLRPGSSSKASVLYMTVDAPGTMPKFTVENYQTGCQRRKRWRLISRGKMHQ